MVAPLRCRSGEQFIVIIEGLGGGASPGASARVWGRPAGLVESWFKKACDEQTSKVLLDGHAGSSNQAVASGGDKPCSQCPGHCLRAGRDIQLLEDAADVKTDGPLTEPQDLGDLPVGLSFLHP